MKINWLKYKFLYFSLSAIVIMASLLALFEWRLNLGVDFRGGTVIEYKAASSVSTEELSKLLKEESINVTSIQEVDKNNYLLKLGSDESTEKDKIKTVFEKLTPSVEEVRFEHVGPSIGPELIKKTLFAVSIAALIILFWVAFQFKSIKYGVSAILAMFHDTFNLIGIYTILGHFLGYEIDFLFVSALLTTLSFSVHDTIVVFDRIREIRKKHGGEFTEIANRALTETMRRSINNSLTIALMLVSLIIFGGSTVKPFASALLIGTILGTYSSPFVAVPILVTWDRFQKRH